MQYAPIEVPTAKEEAELIDLIIAGDTASFYRLIQPHQRRLFRIALAVLRNDADAEDVVQETLVRAFQNLRSFRNEARFSTWLTSIALNEAKRNLRERGRYAFAPIDSNPEYFLAREEPNGPGQEIERRELLALVHQALSGLQSEYRQIFFLREIQEVSTQNAAEELGIPISLVKVRLFRAKRLLRNRLNSLMYPQFRKNSGMPRAGRRHSVKSLLSATDV